MKAQTLFISFALLLTTHCFSQDPAPKVPDNWTPERTDMFMFQYNYETLLDFPDSVSLSPWSRGVNVLLMYDHILPGSKHWSVGIGVGFGSHNYFMEGNILALPDTNGGTYSNFYPFGPNNQVKRHKVVRNFIDIPVEFRFRSRPNERGHQWKIALGAKLGYRTNIYSKTISNAGDKFKSFIYPDVARSRYGITGRIGYGKVSVNGYYSLSNFFNENKGPIVTPLSIGVTLTFF